MWAAKVGAIAYALWSVLHIVLGITRLSDRAADGNLSDAAGRLAQGHWTLLYLGILGLFLSWFNLKNDKTAYWLSAFIISAEDIGFLLFPVWHGGLEPPASIIGPGLWLIGLVFTTIAYRSHKNTDKQI